MKLLYRAGSASLKFMLCFLTKELMNSADRRLSISLPAALEMNGRASSPARSLPGAEE